MGYRPTKRAGGNTGAQIYHSFQRETSCRAGEPPRPVRDSHDLLKHEDIWIRRRCRVADEASRKTVSIGRGEGNRPDPDEGGEVDLNVEGRGKLAELRGISRPAPIYDQGPTLHYVSFDCRQESPEGYLVACHRQAGEDRNHEDCC